MSSLATAPGRPAAGALPDRTVPSRPRLIPESALAGGLTGGLAGGLVLLAFITSGGVVALGPNTWAEIVLLLIAAALVAALIVAGPGGRAWGAGTFVLFAAIALLTALSIGWSVAPDVSWVEAGRTAGYLAAFGGAMALARLLPTRWPSLLGALALAAVAVSAWAVLIKVFSWPIQGQLDLGRLLAPFGYWNATGLMAALGLPPLLWAGGRRGRGRAARALAAPGVALLITVVVLSYSRSATAAAVAGTALFLAFGQTRLRSTVTLALGGAGAAVICAWALSTPALTQDKVLATVRVSTGHSFGVVLVAVLAALAAAGLMAAYLSDRSVLSEFTRRRVGAGLVALLALIPILGLAALATSSRGLFGEMGHIWGTLTSTKLSVGNTPTRLVALANSRPRYWRQGLSVGAHHLVAGAGAGGFGTAYTAYSTARLTANPVGHAHSYIVETFADFGLIGVILNLALLVSWSAASARTIGRRRGGRQSRAASGPPSARTITQPERDGMWALLGVVVAFGVSSAVDWTWFYPGVTVPALICAGWVAARGPLTATAPARLAGRRRPLTERPGAILALSGLCATALVCAWAVWQPLRSADAAGAAIGAASARNFTAALADARAAHADDPESLGPLQEISSLYTALGNRTAAMSALVEGTQLQPANPASWSALGNYDLTVRHEPRQALAALRRAAKLDITSTALPAEIGAARAEVRR